MKLRFLLSLLVVLAANVCLSQSEVVVQNNKENRFFITWGYNRAYYNASDINFKGAGYDFTLEQARAVDMPEKFDPAVYLNPTQLTIPQFNFRIGYYFRKNTAISAGWDHMKYRLITNQTLRISGYIDEEQYHQPEYTGQFNHDYIKYSPAFMDYHHSDGFNYIRFALEQRLPFWQSANGKVVACMNGALSVGAMMPWTDFTFFGERNRNKPHFAGYGGSVLAGARIEFTPHFFLQINAQAGRCNMPDIVLELPKDSRASQKISFFERSWALGGYFGFKRPVRIGSKYD
ncbi:MAG: hypothetical protein ACKVOR_02095 [Flavobacteriales bacterium]